MQLIILNCPQTLETLHMLKHKAEISVHFIMILNSLPQMHNLLMVLHQEWNLHGIEDREYLIRHNWCQDEHVQGIYI